MSEELTREELGLPWKNDPNCTADVIDSSGRPVAAFMANYTHEFALLAANNYHALREALEKHETDTKQAIVLLDDIKARVSEILYHHSQPKKTRHGNTTRMCEDIKTRLAVAKALLATHPQEEAKHGN